MSCRPPEGRGRCTVTQRPSWHGARRDLGTGRPERPPFPSAICRVGPRCDTRDQDRGAGRRGSRHHRPRRGGGSRRRRKRDLSTGETDGLKTAETVRDVAGGGARRQCGNCRKWQKVRRNRSRSRPRYRPLTRGVTRTSRRVVRSRYSSASTGRATALSGGRARCSRSRSTGIGSL